MRQWHRHSPYGAVGIYIGGSDRACDSAISPRPGSARRLPRAGGSSPCTPGRRPPSGAALGGQPGHQGRGGRRRPGRALGFGPRTPIYYDMEAYPARVTGAALRFFVRVDYGAAPAGYLSGVLRQLPLRDHDLAREYSGHTYAMPDAIYDALWNVQECR